MTLGHGDRPNDATASKLEALACACSVCRQEKTKEAIKHFCVGVQVSICRLRRPKLVDDKDSLGSLEVLSLKQRSGDCGQELALPRRRWIPLFHGSKRWKVIETRSGIVDPVLDENAFQIGERHGIQYSELFTRQLHPPALVGVFATNLVRQSKV
jgi:hypothetical protein